jgi:hypothetical protein
MERCWHREAAQRPTFTEIIALLQRVLVDVAVVDVVGNEFWKAHLLSHGISASWDRFKEKLCVRRSPSSSSSIVTDTHTAPCFVLLTGVPRLAASRPDC